MVFRKLPHLPHHKTYFFLPGKKSPQNYPASQHLRGTEMRNPQKYLPSYQSQLFKRRQIRYSKSALRSHCVTRNITLQRAEGGEEGQGKYGTNSRRQRTGYNPADWMSDVGSSIRRKCYNTCRVIIHYRDGAEGYSWN